VRPPQSRWLSRVFADALHPRASLSSLARARKPTEISHSCCAAVRGLPDVVAGRWFLGRDRLPHFMDKASRPRFDQLFVTIIRRLWQIRPQAGSPARLGASGPSSRNLGQNRVTAVEFFQIAIQPHQLCVLPSRAAAGNRHTCGFYSRCPHQVSGFFSTPTALGPAEHIGGGKIVPGYGNAATATSNSLGAPLPNTFDPTSCPGTRLARRPVTPRDAYRRGPGGGA